MNKTSLVVKDNVLINASYNLELTEQRLILLAIVHARETGQGITANSILEIYASDYAVQFNVTKDAAYLALKQAVDSLFQRQFTFTESYKNIIKKVKSRWVSRIAYVDKFGVLEITFAPDVVPFIVRLEKHFTSYQLKQVSSLTSKYAIRLYELLIAWREVGKTPQIELLEFRQKIGLDENEYPTMDNLKRRVLEPAIKQINEYTDIKITYEQHKKVRTIVGFSFKIKTKETKTKTKEFSDPKVNNKKIIMTEAQRHLFAHKLARHHLIATKYAQVGEEYSDLEKRIFKFLDDEKFIKDNRHLLEEVGFSYTK